MAFRLSIDDILKEEMVMRPFRCSWFAAALMVIPLLCKARDNFNSASPAYVADSLCIKPDQIVFSCSLSHSKKRVSICARGTSPAHDFYYSFGRQSRIELTYPSNDERKFRPLNLTRVSYASSWSAAFSFVLQGHRYIVNAVEGMTYVGADGNGSRRPYHAGALLVQKVGADEASMTMDCAEKNIRYNEDLIREASRLEPDPALKDHLPY